LKFRLIIHPGKIKYLNTFTYAIKGILCSYNRYGHRYSMVDVDMKHAWLNINGFKPLTELSPSAQEKEA